MRWPLESSPGAAHVLVVDDDENMVALIRRIVERLGHHCVTATSGEGALECLASAPVDLLVTDVNMRGLSGLELLDAVGKANPDVAVIVVSGVDDPDTTETALASGAFGYIVKPFDVTELRIAVSNALRRRELEIELRHHLHDLEAEVDRRTTQLQNATEEARVQERRFRSLTQASPLGIIYADSARSLDFCNTNAEFLLGRRGDQLNGRRWLEDIDSTNRHLLEAAIEEASAGVPDAMCEYELRRPDGTTLWIQSRVAPVLGSGHNASGVIVLFEDISDRKRLEYQLRHQASHDHLTALPNRREFRRQLADRLVGLDQETVVGILLVDLDQFKLVNDTYGHEAGDQLITTVAQRLIDTVPNDALVARLGGDEYVVAVSDVQHDQVVGLAENVRVALREPVRLLGVELSLSASVGIGVTGDPQTPVSSLLRSADIAMHQAKNRRDAVEVFDASMAKDVARRLAVTSELRRAVADQLLTVHYQPVVDAATQRLVGLEALARWTHHEWGRIGPDEFIPIAESVGLVHEIDKQVLTTAITQLANWRNADRIEPSVFMSVNVSASQISNSALPDMVGETLERAGIEGSSICIEVTETSLVGDIDRALPVLRGLRALGIRIAVDDFGTGHSALSYLGQLPLDVLKIDRSFIAAIGSGGVDLAEAIVELAHRFELAVVAEGVEEIHQLSQLRSFGCDMVQGFLTGRPTEADRAVVARQPEPLPLDVAPLDRIRS